MQRIVSLYSGHPTGFDCGCFLPCVEACPALTLGFPVQMEKQNDQRFYLEKKFICFNESGCQTELTKVSNVQTSLCDTLD